MTEEMKYYTGSCITDLHTDTSISHCNEEKCKQYIKPGGLNFCMSSVCPEKDCIYALVNKLHQTIDRLEQENFALTQESQQKSQTICELEQENNSLQAQLNNITVKSNNAITVLEQENKELKSDVLKWQKAFSRQYQINENKGYSKAEENYRSALEEILEKIKSLNKHICDNCGWHNTDNCQPNGYVCHDLIEIKNKINEVLGDN